MGKIEYNPNTLPIKQIAKFFGRRQGQRTVDRIFKDIALSNVPYGNKQEMVENTLIWSLDNNPNMFPVILQALLDEHRLSEESLDELNVILNSIGYSVDNRRKLSQIETSSGKRPPLPHETLDSILHNLNISTPSDLLDPLAHQAGLKNPSEIADDLYDDLQAKTHDTSNHKAPSIKSQKRLFISHSSEDREFVERLIDRLQRSGVDVWYNKWEIKVGDSIVDKINDGLKKSDHLVIVLSKNSIKSKWVKEELNAATINNITTKKAFILPVLIEDCKIPELLAHRKYADFRQDFQYGISELLSSIS